MSIYFGFSCFSWHHLAFPYVNTGKTGKFTWCCYFFSSADPSLVSACFSSLPVRDLGLFPGVGDGEEGGLVLTCVISVGEVIRWEALSHYQPWNFKVNTLIGKPEWSKTKMSNVRGFIFILLILISTLDFILGRDVDSGYWGCGHARGHHCAEQLLRLGPVCRGLPAEQQPADHRGGAHRLLGGHPVLHHVCGKKLVFWK